VSSEFGGGGGRCRPECGWNLLDAISSKLRLSDQAARSIGRAITWNCRRGATGINLGRRDRRRLRPNELPTCHPGPSKALAGMPRSTYRLSSSQCGPWSETFAARAAFAVGSLSFREIAHETVPTGHAGALCEAALRGMGGGNWDVTSAKTWPPYREFLPDQRTDG
jgi:hypothetical protein